MNSKENITIDYMKSIIKSNFGNIDLFFYKAIYSLKVKMIFLVFIKQISFTIRLTQNYVYSTELKKQFTLGKN